MASHTAFIVPAGLRSEGRPQAPIVDAALVQARVLESPLKVWSVPKVECDGFIPPKALTPQDFEEPTAFPMRRLMALVSGVSWVTRHDLVSIRKDARISKARQILCWLAKRHTALSLPQIGRHLGDRDHTTILYSVRKVQAVVDRLNIEKADCPVSMAKRLWAADWSKVSK